MTLGIFTLTFDFWLPWAFGLDKGWGCKWLDMGPFTIWWSDSTLEKG